MNRLKQLQQKKITEKTLTFVLFCLSYDEDMAARNMKTSVQTNFNDQIAKSKMCI